MSFEEQSKYMDPAEQATIDLEYYASVLGVSADQETLMQEARQREQQARERLNNAKTRDAWLEAKNDLHIAQLDQQNILRAVSQAEWLLDGGLD